MRQLTSLDAQFLALESARQTGHVAGLAILDPTTSPGGTLDLEDLKRLMQERLPLLPPLRWRLSEVPLGLDYPYWIDDPDFDLDFHVRDLALTSPGADKQLAEQISRIVARPLDRSRPLWELYVIHGLEGGTNVAVLTKIHHALIDGMSGAEIMGLLLDLSPEGRELPDAPEPAPDRDPSDLELLGRSLVGLPRYPLRLLRSLPAAVPNIDETPFGVLPGAGTVSRLAAALQRAVGGGDQRRSLERKPLVAPKTSFNGRISPHRRFAFGSLRLEAVKEVKNAHGCTVNDVVVSVCASAVRRWLIEHDELPADPLVAQIPISVRSDDQAGTYGNRIMLMAAPLLTDEPDPVRRLYGMHEAMSDMKERHRALPAEL
ncbi:MAG: diacylglycerol O-acyltransferase / wax synthase, partial [Thermoleophilaceae bacterium]|nr:diacylglycerol O-acyltransferase / wax synthase [Thermoleophilaceae bacterium]